MLKENWWNAIGTKNPRELTFDLNTFQFTTCCHLQKIGKVSKLGIWFLCILCENKEDCISIAKILLSRQRNYPFLKNDSQVTKNVSFTIMFNAKGSGLTRKNHRSLPQKWSLMEEKLCVYQNFSRSPMVPVAQSAGVVEYTDCISAEE